MKAKIVRIGNSRGIRIPKPLLAQAGLEGDVDLRVEDGAIIITKSSHPRDGWAEAARRAAAAGEGRLLEEPTPTHFDEEEWQW